VKIAVVNTGLLVIDVYEKNSKQLKTKLYAINAMQQVKVETKNASA
jgi:hypothetical protein